MEKLLLFVDYRCMSMLYLLFASRLNNVVADLCYLPRQDPLTLYQRRVSDISRALTVFFAILQTSTWYTRDSRSHL